MTWKLMFPHGFRTRNIMKRLNAPSHSSQLEKCVGGFRDSLQMWICENFRHIDLWAADKKTIIQWKRVTLLQRGRSLLKF
jgi:hypothetical protein